MTISSTLRLFGGVLGVSAMLAAGTSIAMAQQGGNQVAKFDHWGVYVSQSGGKKICYALSAPADRQPEGLKRDPGYLFISYRPAEKVRDEVAFVMGFSVKEGVAPGVTVGSEKFSLVARGPNVWAKTSEDQARLIAAMTKGATMSVSATSLRGNKTVDQYSLTGFSKAIERTRQECK